DYLAAAGEQAFWLIIDAADYSWRDAFASYENIKSATPPPFVIRDFLQAETPTFISGLPGHGKSFVLLSIVRALLEGSRLFGHFDVLQKAQRVIYLTPEVTLNALYRRLQLFKLDPYLQDGRLLVRTLTEGPVLQLTDPDLLVAARGAHVFLDTAIRFMEGVENQSIE